VSAAAVVIFSSAWFALAIICGMLAEYRHKISAALRFEPIPSEQRFRAGQPVITVRRRA
jgi:hypothetical protein